MKKILLVAYQFPPVGGAGVQRSIKFVKYLRCFGWEPLVLTVENPSVPVIDSALSRDLPDGVEVRRAKTLEPSYRSKESYSAARATGASPIKKLLKTAAAYLLLPDVQVLWWPFLTLELCRCIREERPDCILVSAPPFSSFIPAALVAPLCRIPLVLDYRDEWGFAREQLENANKSAWARITDRWFERFAIGNASAVTAANSSYLANLRELYPPAARKICRVIPNGYDDEDFRGVRGGKTASQGPIRIVYTGTVWKTTSLAKVVAALVKVAGAGDAPPFQLDIYGRILPTELDSVVNDRTKSFVSVHGYVEHDIVVQRMYDADILLITLANLPGAGRIITGKVFEYMATGNHIVAAVPDGETASIVGKEYDNATILDPDDLDGMVESFRSIFDRIGALRGVRGNCPSAYLRKNLTGKLAELLNELAQNPAEGGGT